MKSKLIILSVLLLSTTVFAGESQNRDLNEVIRTLKRIHRYQADLLTYDEIQFQDNSAKRRFQNSLRAMRKAISDLQGGGDEEAENYRGRSVVLIENEISNSFKNDCIQALPQVVHKTDFDFLPVLFDEVSSMWVAENMKAYFKNHSNHASSKNVKGEAAKLLANELSRIYLTDCLATLPQRLTADDMAAVRSIVDNNSDSRVLQALKNYFGAGL